MINNLKLVISCSLLVMVLTACQTTTGPYSGALVAAERVIRLDMAGAEVQQWQDLYLTIDSVLTGSHADSVLTGSIHFSIRPQAMFRYVSEVTLWVFLLDENSRVLSFQAVSHSVGYQLDAVTTFSTNLQIPPNAVAYTFGYEASFLDDQGIVNLYQNFPGNP